ncbi:hypothetical protein [Aeromicrobium sp. 179-A 4D2 NHS]|uniref:hypothetical protein n=1 Tax=Aeromicrobium sp. 179-A 4D2 NHS TaxID=3142375 RepID=UPI0039A39137
MSASDWVEVWFYAALVLALASSVHSLRGAMKASRAAEETATRTLAMLESLKHDPNAALRARAEEQMTLAEETIRESQRLIEEAFEDYHRRR